MPEDFEITFQDRSFIFPEQMDRDHVHRKIKSAGTFYEIELLQYVANHVTTPGVAIDCGANIGNHTLFFAGVLGLRTLAVEPVARNYRILEKVLELNGLTDDVDVIRMALDEKAGEVTMTLDDPGNFGMYKVGEGDGPSVKTTTLDTLTRDLDAPVRLIKIDVEGFQNQVIRGAKDTLQKHKPLIAAELASTEEYNSFLALIAPFGYVPANVFNRTPTMVFCADGTMPDNSISVVASLRAYERRMVFIRPIQKFLTRLQKR